MKTINVGTDETLDYLSDSISTDNFFPCQVRTSSFNLVKTDKQAEIAVSGWATGIGAHGWAMAWTSFKVEGNSTTFAKVDVNNVEYRMKIGTMGTATSRENVSIFMEDITNDKDLRKIDNSDRVDEFESVLPVRMYLEEWRYLKREKPDPEIVEPRPEGDPDHRSHTIVEQWFVRLLAAGYLTVGGYAGGFILTPWVMDAGYSLPSPTTVGLIIGAIVMAGSIGLFWIQSW